MIHFCSVNASEMSAVNLPSVYCMAQIPRLIAKQTWHSRACDQVESMIQFQEGSNWGGTTRYDIVKIGVLLQFCP